MQGTARFPASGEPCRRQEPSEARPASRRHGTHKVVDRTNSPQVLVFAGYVSFTALQELPGLRARLDRCSQRARRGRIWRENCILCACGPAARRIPAAGNQPEIGPDLCQNRPRNSLDSLTASPDWTFRWVAITSLRVRRGAAPTSRATSTQEKFFKKFWHFGVEEFWICGILLSVDQLTFAGSKAGLRAHRSTGSSCW